MLRSSCFMPGCGRGEWEMGGVNGGEEKSLEKRRRMREKKRTFVRVRASNRMEGEMGRMGRGSQSERKCLEAAVIVTLECVQSRTRDDRI